MEESSTEVKDALSVSLTTPSCSARIPKQQQQQQQQQRITRIHDPPRWGVRPGWAGERDFDFRDMRDFEISGLSTDVNRGKNTDHI